MLKSLVLSAVSLVASQATQNPLYQVRVDVPLVTVDVMVSDANGRPVTNLTREDFSIFEDGKPQPLQSFSPVDAPYSILLLIDRSQSMQTHWALMQPAMSRLISQLKPQDRISIGAFDERSKDVEVLLDWREARGAGTLQIAINPVIRANNENQVVSISGGGFASVMSPRKDFHAALEWAAKRLAPIGTRSGAIVFSDGRQPDTPTRTEEAGGRRQVRLRDPRDDSDFQNLQRSIQKGSSLFYFLAINTDLNPNDGRFSMDSVNLGMPVRLRLEALAAALGGKVLLPLRIEDTPALYEQIGRDLGTAYTLSYAPPASQAGTAHRIEVRVRNGVQVRQSRDNYATQP